MPASKTRKEKRQKEGVTKPEPKPETTPALTIQKGKVEDVPKTHRRKTGEYNHVSEALKNLPTGEQINFVVPTRPTAAGYLKAFGEKYDVITRSVFDEKDPKKLVGVRVYIGAKGSFKKE